MKPSTVALLVLGVAGAGAGIYFLTRQSGGAVATAAPAPVDPKLALIAGATQIGIKAVSVVGSTVAAVGSNAAKAVSASVSAIVSTPAKTITAAGHAVAAVASAPVSAVTSAVSSLFGGPSVIDQVKAAAAKQKAQKEAVAVASKAAAQAGAKAAISTSSAFGGHS